MRRPKSRESEPEASSDDEFDEAAWREFLEQRRSLTQQRFEAGLSLDRTLFAVSVSALGFSIGVLQYLVGDREPHHVSLLTSALVLFGVAILFGILALYLGGKAFDREIEILDDSRTDPDSYESAENELTSSANAYQILQIGSLAVGIALLIGFAATNIRPEGVHQRVTAQEEVHGKAEENSGQEEAIIDRARGNAVQEGTAQEQEGSEQGAPEGGPDD